MGYKHTHANNIPLLKWSNASEHYLFMVNQVKQNSQYRPNKVAKDLVLVLY